MGFLSVQNSEGSGSVGVNCAAWFSDQIRDINGTSIAFPAIGLDDFSIECWHLHLPDGELWDHDDNAPTGVFNAMHTGYRGYLAGAGDNSLGLGYSGNQAIMTFGYGRTWAGHVYPVLAALPDDGEWHHWCATYNRAGNATFYIDGAVQGAIGIAAEAAVNMTTCGTSRFIAVNSGLITGTLDRHAMGLTGAAAFHRTVLDAEQIKKSVFDRTVQVLATTEGAWDFRVMEQFRPEYVTWTDTTEFLAASGRVFTGWTYHIGNFSFSYYSPTLGAFYTPLVLKDLSGNGYDIGVNQAANRHLSFDPRWK